MSQLCFGKPVLVRSSRRLSVAFSASCMQTPPCSVTYEADHGRLMVVSTSAHRTFLEKKVPLELIKDMGTIGSCNGWVATLGDDAVLRLQDDLNPDASGSDPKRIALTLPHCQTTIVTNVTMSSSSPENRDCVVAVKFLGPQVSFCCVAVNKLVWQNFRITNRFFHSSPVVFSKRESEFRILGSGGHLIGTWDWNFRNLKMETLQFLNLPRLTKAQQELMDLCCTSEHLVDSPSTNETFLVKWYRKTVPGTSEMKTEFLMVFKLDNEGNAVYTRDIGDVCIFLSKSEPFCVDASSFPDMPSNQVMFCDNDEDGFVLLQDSTINTAKPTFRAPYYIPPPGDSEWYNWRLRMVQLVELL